MLPPTTLLTNQTLLNFSTNLMEHYRFQAIGRFADSQRCGVML